ncbi:MAG: hypothetical protein U0791_18480 [Gemmataceae bacterium]
MNESAYYSGLDLGQPHEFTALVVVERRLTTDFDRPSRSVSRFDVRHIHRWPLGTNYPAIAADLKNLFAEKPLKGSELIIDQTGVGRAVVDLIRSSEIAASMRAYTITAGETGHGRTVAKKNLVGAVQAPLQERRLRFAESLPLTPTLARELEMFRTKATFDNSDVFAGWRERDHDDLVLGLALALYAASIPPITITTFIW